MAIWSSPTIDVAKKRIYVGTGDNYSEPGTDTSDAVVALDLKTGKLLWSAQFDKDDIYKMECGAPPAAGCEPPTVPEFDLGASPILVALPSHKRVLLLGQKTGIIYGVDPDARGKLLWFKHAGVGGLLGGVQWGPATDGSSVYVAVSDLAFGRGGPDPTKGGGISAYRVDDGTLLWKTPPPGCGDRRPCSPAQSQAISAIPGAVFSGSIDGHLRAYATSRRQNHLGFRYRAIIRRGEQSSRERRLARRRRPRHRRRHGLRRLRLPRLRRHARQRPPRLQRRHTSRGHH